MSLQKQFVIPAMAALLALGMSGCGGGGAASGGGGGGSFNPGDLAAKMHGNFLSGGSGGSNNNTMREVGMGLQAADTERQSLALGPADEPAMGQSVAAVAIARYGVYRNPKVERYVNLVGLTLVSVSAAPDATWSFIVLDTDQVNAFSGPAGYVMITRGLLRRMQDESELAGVLAHEIGHVVNHDGLNAAKTALQNKAILQGISAGSRQFARFQAGTDGAVGKILDAGYDRSQEDAADKYAVGLAAAAGYDPNGYLHLTERLAAAERGGGSIMSTHPGLSDRVGRIRATIAGIGSPGGKVLRERFVENVQ